MFIIGSSAGCTALRDREARLAQPDATNTGQNPSNQVAAQPNNLNFVAVAQKVGHVVVRIDATRTVNVPGASGNFLIERFFGSELTQQRTRCCLSIKSINC